MSRSRLHGRRPSSSGSSAASSQGGYEQPQGNSAAVADMQSGDQEQGSWLSRLFGGGSRDQGQSAPRAIPVAEEGGDASAWAAVQSGNLTLRKGSAGPAVRHLQTLLVSQGAGIGVDGQFGNGTEGAVKRFQAAKGLQVDGVVGRGTAGALSGGRVAPAPQSGAREAADAREAARGGGASQATERGRGQGGRANIAVNADSFVRQGLRREVFATALKVFQTAFARGDTQKMVYTVIDFSLPSDQKRMWVIDLQSGRLLFHELVSHGANSGGRYATDFSNTSGSNKSSIGLARTAETYHSAKFGGTALRMDGLEQGYNTNMRNRAVVMHQADYATPEAIEENRRNEGAPRLGRSQGCPAMDPRVAGEVIQTIKNGSLVFSYYPDPKYMQQSKYVNG
jgi:peptidoglycan hydrolase-like protein with peptidoglycan-binding domain